MIQEFCQAPESLQSRLGAGSYRPAVSTPELSHLGLPSAHRRKRRLPCSRARAGQGLRDTAATMDPHRSRILHLQPSPLPCAGCHTSQILCQDNTAISKAGNGWLFFYFPLLFFLFFCFILRCMLLAQVQWIDTAHRGGRGWLGWGGGSHWPGSKQRGARKAEKQICLSSWLYSIIQLCLLNLKVCVIIGFVKQSASPLSYSSENKYALLSWDGGWEGPLTAQDGIGPTFVLWIFSCNFFSDRIMQVCALQSGSPGHLGQTTTNWHEQSFVLNNWYNTVRTLRKTSIHHAFLL